MKLGWMNANELHVHQSFEECFFWVGLMVLFAISFHSLAWLQRGLATTLAWLRPTPFHLPATQARGSFLA